MVLCSGRGVEYESAGSLDGRDVEIDADERSRTSDVDRGDMAAHSSVSRAQSTECVEAVNDVDEFTSMLKLRHLVDLLRGGSTCAELRFMGGCTS